MSDPLTPRIEPHTSMDDRGILHLVQMLGPGVPGTRTRCGMNAGLIQQQSLGRVNCKTCRIAAGHGHRKSSPHLNGPNHGLPRHRRT